MPRRPREGAQGKRGAGSFIDGFRRSFIRTNMAFVAVVLVIVMAIVGFVSYRSAAESVQAALDRRASFYSAQAALEASAPDNGGGDDLAGAGSSDGAVPDDAPQVEEAPVADDAGVQPGGGEGDAAAGGRRESGDDQVVATSAYEVADDGGAEALEDTLDLDSATVASAVDAAQEALSASGGSEASGRISQLNLYYKIVSTEGGTYLVLASGNYIDRTMFALMSALGIACVAALGAFFAVSVLLARRAVAPVERAWREQKQFIADASHELKTPLTVILANVSILKAQGSQTVNSQMKWVDSTQVEARQMQGLVNDMLYLAKVEDAQTVAVRERIDFSELVEGAVLQFESVAFERGVVLEDAIEPGLYVEGDPARLQRMVGTLVDNACKYAGAAGSVRLGLTERGRACELAVHNTGSPISPEDLPHVFDRFYRADKARTSGEGGFGLGLSIAQNIARDHAGTISVESSEAAGTTFTVVLPLAK